MIPEAAPTSLWAIATDTTVIAVAPTEADCRALYHFLTTDAIVRHRHARGHSVAWAWIRRPLIPIADGGIEPDSTDAGVWIVWHADQCFAFRSEHGARCFVRARHAHRRLQGYVPIASVAQRLAALVEYDLR